jgi:hypothetical protein
VHLQVPKNGVSVSPGRRTAVTTLAMAVVDYQEGNKNNGQKNKEFCSLFLGRFLGGFLFPETKKLVEKIFPVSSAINMVMGFCPLFHSAHAARRPLKNHRKKKEKKLFIKPLV